MSFYMKLYLLMHKKHFKTRYKVRWRVNSRNLLNRISEMLENDIPVVLSIGPCLIRGRKKELPLYSIKSSTSNDNFNSENQIDYEQVNSVKDHYVNVTGIYKLSEENNPITKTMLEISSWGKKYYINFDEYVRFVKKYDNFLFSNILYIQKK